MKGRLLASISKEEYEDCQDGLNIHKHWHKDGGIVEFYMIDEPREELEDNLREYVSPSTNQSSNIIVQTLDLLDWQQFVSQAEKGRMFLTPEKPSEDQYQIALYPESKAEEVGVNE